MQDISKPGFYNELSGEDFLKEYGFIESITVKLFEEGYLAGFFRTKSLLGFIVKDAFKIILNACKNEPVFGISGNPISDVIAQHLKFADIYYNDEDGKLQSCPTLFTNCKQPEEDYDHVLDCKYWQDKINDCIRIEHASSLLKRQIEECGGVQWEDDVYSDGDVISVLGKCKNYGCYYLVTSNINPKVYVPIHKYSFIDYFEDEYARVNIEDKVTGNKRWGIINCFGREIVPVIYDEIWKFYGKRIQNVKLIKDGKIKWFNKKTGHISDSFPPIFKEQIDYELGCSGRDTFYALTDGMYGDYEDFCDDGGDIDSLKTFLGLD